MWSSLISFLGFWNFRILEHLVASVRKTYRFPAWNVGDKARVPCSVVGPTGMQIDANRICVPQRLRIKSRSCFDTHNSCFTLVIKFLDIMILIFYWYLTYAYAAGGSNFVTSVECFQTQAETPATMRSHRDWQTLPPVVTTRCLAIHLECSEIEWFSTYRQFSRAEFDCFQPRLKFWLKIRSCHSCRCCSWTFDPKDPGLLSPIPPSRDEAPHMSWIRISVDHLRQNQQMWSGWSAKELYHLRWGLAKVGSVTEELVQ